MRFLRLLLLLGLAAGLPCATAQTPSPAFKLDVTVPALPIEPGNHTVATLTASRICPSVGQVLDPQTVGLQVVVPDGLIASGPSQVQFDQQVCLQQSIQSVDAVYRFDALREANESVFPVRVTAHPQPTGALAQGGNEVTARFTITVEHPQTVSQEAVYEQEAPAPAGALVLTALVGLATVLRRRA